MDTDTLTFLQVTLLCTNIVELVFAVFYFLTTPLPHDFYIYAPVFQFAIGGIFLFVIFICRMEPDIKSNWRIYMPFLTHFIYHLIGYVITLNTITYMTVTAIIAMIAKSISAINVFLIVLEGKK